MENLITETPEKWVVLKIPNGHYKVFASWCGDYLNGDSWKINSGIKEIDEDENYYYFIGFSGSCYKCDKKKYGVATYYTSNVLGNIIENANGLIELLNSIDDFVKVMNDEFKL